MRKATNQNLFGELLTYDQTMQRSNLGRSAVVRLAKESGSLVKIGRSARIDWQRFYDYLVREYSAE